MLYLYKFNKKDKNMYRWLLASAFFFIGLIAYMDRANISVVASFIMNEFSINKTTFGMLNSLFFLAYALGQIPAGILTQKLGNKTMIILGLFFWSIFTILTPLASSFLMLCIIRILFGLGESPIFVSSTSFNNNWFGSKEKAMAASFVLAGSYFGPVIAPFISVWLLENYGWQSVFYVFGFIGLIIACIFYIFSSSSPENNKFVSKKELDFILKERSNSIENKIPLKNFLNNKELYALGIAYFCVIYIYGMFMVWLPTFLLEAKGMDLKSMGIYAGAPWLCLSIAVAFSGIVSDIILKTTNDYIKSRIHLAILGLLLFAISIYFVIYSDSFFISILALSLGFGFLGFPIVTCWAICIDKGRSHAATLSAYMNFYGCIGTTISPLVIGYLVEHYNWNIAILINLIPATIGIIALFFVKPQNKAI